jgi:crotonobetainyl-CoA:carnitine CoA-transferase CaiB-like acyl-CoA transferase
MEMPMSALAGLRVVSLAINAPGPIAAAALRDLGATVIKVEPPTGDPLRLIGDAWYTRLTDGMDVRTLDLKDPAGQAAFEALLADADLLLTAQRPASLARLGITWDALHARYPRLGWVGIVGYPPPNENVAGHDLTYQAAYGTLTPPHMPRVLLADMAGAERAVSAALALLLARERGQGAGHTLVALSDAAKAFAATVPLGITTPGGILGGGLPNYRMYATAEGWLAVAALEPHFNARLCAALEVDGSEDALKAVLQQRSAEDWEAWGLERDLPLAAIHGS